MTALNEVLLWSRSRPDWQRDALRRLAVGGELSDGDIRCLVEICKAAHGLAEPRKGRPLAREHVPAATRPGSPVSLESIVHRRGVNALADDQTLRFSPHLTVV